MTEALRLKLQAEAAMWRQRGDTHLRLLLEEAIAALAQPPAPTAQQCPCGNRPADQCPGEWEPGCDLGANPAYVRVAQPAADERLRMALRADLATESLAVDDLLRAMGEDPETYRTEGGAINRPRLLAWLKDRDAQPVQQPEPEVDGWPLYSGLPPAQRQPLTQDQILDMADGVSLQFHDLLEFARAIEAAHGITAAPAAKGE